jgi:hypothetical protein
MEATCQKKLIYARRLEYKILPRMGFPVKEEKIYRKSSRCGGQPVVQTGGSGRGFCNSFPEIVFYGGSIGTVECFSAVIPKVS